MSVADDHALLTRWALTGLPGRLTIASYLTEPQSPVYQLIVDILLDQQQASLTGVGRDELTELIGARLGELPDDSVHDLGDTIDLNARMGQLHTWGVVDVWQDRAVRDEDFLRNRDRYQLTVAGAALHRAIRALGSGSAATIAAILAPAVLAVELERFAAALTCDPSAAANSWSVLQSTTKAMADAAAAWQSQLAAALAGAPTAAKVTTAQDTISRYVDMWGAGVDVHTRHITAHLATLNAVEDQAWRDVALVVVGAEADETRLDAATAEVRATTRLIGHWFTGPRAQAPQLRSQMARSVAPMIRGQRTVAAVGGHVSRRRELLGLAARLDRATSDQDAWDTWCMATGLFAAVHLGTASAQPPASGTSFWDAEPAPVEARLRAQGPRALTGRPAHMPDRTAARAAARAAAALAAQRTAQLRRDLLALSGRALSDLPDLAGGPYQELLDILHALAGPLARQRRDPAAAAGPVELTTTDGVWQVRAVPLPGDAVVHTDQGRLVHPDLVLHLALAGTPA